MTRLEGPTRGAGFVQLVSRFRLCKTYTGQSIPVDQMMFLGSLMEEWV